MLSQLTSFDDLPAELLSLILDHLAPEQLVEAALVEKRWRDVIQANVFWRRKYKRHFPGYFSRFNHQEYHFWFREFGRAYQADYRGLSHQERRLFSLVKEGDDQSLCAMTIPFSGFETRDKNGTSLVTWVMRVNNQSVFNHFYQSACNQYALEDHSTVDVLRKDEDDKTIFFWALALRQMPDVLAALLAQGSQLSEVYYSQGSRWRPIHIAARAGRLNVVQALTENRPELLEEGDAYHQTPLLFAATNNRREVVAYLISRGVNLNAATHSPGLNDHGRTALYWAAMQGHGDVVRQLMRAGAVATTALGFHRWQPIHVAAANGFLDVLQALVECQPNLLEQQDADGETPLLLAARGGHKAVVEYLIYQGANVNVATNHPGDDTHGKTALYWAAYYRFEAVVRRLLDAGAVATTALGRERLQPIHIAAREGYWSLVGTLIERRPELLEQKDVYGRTPLLIAASGGESNRGAAVTYLIRKGADLNVKVNRPGHDDHGRTVFKWAAGMLLNGLVPMYILRDIDQSKLSAEVRAQLRLIKYISKKRRQLDFRRTLMIFGREVKLGRSPRKKFEAAMELNKFYICGVGDRVRLFRHEKQFRRGKLGAIFRDFEAASLPAPGVAP